MYISRHNTTLTQGLHNHNHNVDKWRARRYQWN